jgi:4a-hydroxytetrahydrobiopterin dehydratase
MTTIALADKKCAACDGKTPKLDAAAIATLHAELRDWTVENGQKLHKDMKFADFARAMFFVNAIAYVAEREGHHPDFTVHGWNKVHVTIWTHDIGGLSENDFILAAKIDALLA